MLTASSDDDDSCKSEGKAVLLRDTPPDLMATRSQLVGQCGTADQPEQPRKQNTICLKNGTICLAFESFWKSGL